MKKEINYKRYEGETLNKFVKNFTYSVDAKKFVGERMEQPKEKDETIAPYFPSDELKDAIEYARLLQRPLLLRGEPGCGKTKLAQALAFDMYAGREGVNYRDKYFEWYIKSTTKAVDGLYHFDHLARLRDVQSGQEKEDLRAYRSFGKLGMAFLTSKPDAPSVLLIDEIDKADLDFPNDLLLELDEGRFYIPETKEEIRAKYPPVIIITSNDEKELPNAFLRRCVFHFIDFPKPEHLLNIAKARVKDQEKDFQKAMPDTLVEDIVEKFYALYQKMKANPNTDKTPSTSELLDWLRVMHYYYFTDKLKLENGKLPDDQLQYPEVLLKSLDDFKQQTQKR